VRTYPYSFHVALDGSGLNGLEGRAGVCVLRYDPDTGDHSYKITYFTGASGGHGTSVSPERTAGFLGNVGQHLLFYDPLTLDEMDRVSTMRFEVSDHALRGSTHVAWLDDVQFVTAIGDQFWRFDVNRLTKAEPIARHGLKLPHAMKRTTSGRYVVYGGMDHPDTGEAREVGILDTVTGAVRRVALPTTCWHVAVHRDLDVFYAMSFRVSPGNGNDWHQWGMSYFREYAYEIDAETGQILRHWTAAKEVPAHVNSDACVSDRELIFCTGGSSTVVLISLDDMATFRLIDERPSSEEQWMHARSAATTVVDAFARGNPFTDSKQFVGALQVSRGSLIDGIYACQLSADQSLLFTANRGRNHITVYDYPSLHLRDRFPMPEIQEFDATVPAWADPRLGFHHSTLLSPPSPVKRHDRPSEESP
jgi:hypothetical protein